MTYNPQPDDAVFNHPELLYAFREAPGSPHPQCARDLRQQTTSSEVGGRRLKFTQLRRMGHMRQANLDWFTSDGVYCGPSDLAGVGNIRPIPMSELSRREKSIQDANAKKLPPIHYETTLFTGQTAGQFALDYLQNANKTKSSATSKRAFQLDMTAELDTLLRKLTLVTVQWTEENRSEEVHCSGLESSINVELSVLCLALLTNCRQTATTVYESDWKTINEYDIRLKVVNLRGQKPNMTLFVKPTY